MQLPGYIFLFYSPKAIVYFQFLPAVAALGSYGAVNLETENVKLKSCKSCKSCLKKRLKPIQPIKQIKPIKLQRILYLFRVFRAD
jgi:hypothetical protein